MGPWDGMDNLRHFWTALDCLYEQDVAEGTGADWLACACGRWLHEECVDDCMKDEEGKDRICPYCLDDVYQKCMYDNYKDYISQRKTICSQLAIATLIILTITTLTLLS